MVRPLSESTSAIKIAILFLIITLVIFLVGFSTPHWTVVGDPGVGVISIGLWQQCLEVYYLGSVCSSSTLGAGESWISIVKALQCVGLVGLALTTAGTAMNIFCVRSRSLKQAVIFVVVMSGVAVLAGCIYYVIKSDIQYLGYSYSLCCVGGCGAFFVGTLLCIDVRREQEPQPEPTVMYSPTQPAAAVYSLPSGPYEGQVLSAPPAGPQGYMGPAPPQYPSPGYTGQGYTDTPKK